jgi:hypothetical protein
VHALYIYAIVDRPEIDFPIVRGFGDAEIGGLRVGDLMAITSPIEGAVPLSRDNLLCHERVIEALMCTRAVLPARFGTTTEGTERLQQTLEAQSASFSANLNRVRGKVEIAVRVGWQPEAAEPQPRPRAADVLDGRGYMQALLAQTQHNQRQRATAEELAARLSARLADLADAVVEKVLPAPQLLLKAAYLVRREHVSEIKQRIETLRADHPALAILATGPWPAYSFVEEGAMA